MHIQQPIAKSPNFQCKKQLLLFLWQRTQRSSGAKVAQIQLLIFIHQHIVGIQIAMADLLLMQMRHNVHNLQRQLFKLWQRQALTLGKGIAGAGFKGGR